MSHFQTGEMLICTNVTDLESGRVIEPYIHLHGEIAIMINASIELKSVIEVYFPRFMQYQDMYDVRFEKYDELKHDNIGEINEDEPPKCNSSI